MHPSIIAKLIAKKDLSSEEAAEAMGSIMRGESKDAQTAAFLAALAAKGESGGELAAFAQIMRKAAQAWPSPDHYPVLCDTCGTGGDNAHALNISTLAAMLLAALGIPVAKHGNRAVSSKSGSADLLERLGIVLELSSEDSTACLRESGICFLFAPRWHSAMKHVAPVRKALGVRTVFNLLGPLSNPAPVTHQIVGVYDPAYMRIMAEALAELGHEAYLVSSTDSPSLDEFSCSAPTYVLSVKGAKVSERQLLAPEDFALQRWPLSALQVSNAEEAATRALAVLEGKGSQAENHAVALNASLLYSLVKNETLEKSAQLCLAAIHEGKGFRLLEKWKDACSRLHHGKP